MSDTKNLNEPPKAETPKVITFIQNYLSPVNALYIFPVTIAAVLDIMSPFGPMLIIAAVLVGILYLFYRWKWTRARAAGVPIKKTTMFLLAGTFLIFSASAVANFNTRHNGGLLANWVPKIKTWQDAYLVSIKQDTEIIKKQNDTTVKKVEQANEMLRQVLASMRPQLERPLVEEIEGYEKLANNEKDALVLLTSKVGVNGIKRYEGLMKAANVYAADRTPANARAVADNLTYIVRINGRDIEDTKTKKELMALFLDTDTYNYLMGSGQMPADTSLIKELNIKTTGAPGQMLDDPLGDLIQVLKGNGEVINEEVVIPTSQKLALPQPVVNSPIITSPAVQSPMLPTQQVAPVQQVRPVAPKPRPKPRTNNGSTGGYVTF